MKNPLTNLAGFLTAKMRENTKEKTQRRPENGSYQEALRSLARPLGEYLSDEFDTVEELFEYLGAEHILPKETVALLKHDRQFCDGFAEGLEAGQEAEEVYSDEDDDEFLDDEYTCGGADYEDDNVGEDEDVYDPEENAYYDDEDEDCGFASQLRQFL